MNGVPCPTCSFIPIEPITKHSKRIEELLASNTPPQLTEQHEFRVIINKYNARLLDLEQNIAKVAAVLEELTRARSETQSHLEDYGALVHPMRSLPSEIILEIFQHSLPPHAEFYELGRPPWTLTRVSRRWRAIGMSSPSLWSHITANLDYLHPADMYQLGQYLERSRGCPLSIDLVGTMDVLNHPSLLFFKASTLRWKKLSMNLPEAPSRFFSENAFPKLQTLEVLAASRLVTLDIVLHSDNEPHLRSLEVNLQDFLGISKSLPPHQATPFISQIAVSLANGHSLANLPMMRSLERLNILVSSWDSAVIDSAISLPELSHLSIRIGYSASLFTFCSYLEAPVLADLTLKFNEDMSFPTFRHPLQRLTRFTVIAWDGFVTPAITQRLLDFLSQVPNVEELFLGEALSTVELIVGLTLSCHASVVKLPRLRILDISACRHLPNLDIEHICALLESRTQGNPMGCAHLEMVRVPRWVYLNDSQRWKAIRRTMKMECAFTLKDDDGLRFEH